MMPPATITTTTTGPQAIPVLYLLGPKSIYGSSAITTMSAIRSNSGYFAQKKRDEDYIPVDSGGTQATASGILSQSIKKPRGCFKWNLIWD